eukprot:jgi/Tetstr1/435657/TSEL_024557.t1
MALVNKWAVFSSAVLLELVSGLQYSFSVYSESLKERHGLSQGQVNAVGTCINFGNCVTGILAGAIFDAISASSRPALAPKVSCGLALLLAAATYPALWALATGRCGPFCDATALAVSVQNFPRFRGQVVGQLKAFVGLSASLHLVAFAAFPASDPANFLILQTVASLLYIAIGLACQNVVPFKQVEEVAQPGGTQRKFVVTFVWGMALAVTVGAASVVPVPHYGEVLMACGVVALFGSLLLWMPVSAGSLLARPEPSVSSPFLHDPLLPSDDDSEAAPQLCAADRDGGDEAKSLLEQLPEVAPFEAWRSSEFWMLYLVVLTGTGAGLAFVNNLGQLVVSYGGKNGDQNIFVALFSVCSCLGRSMLGEASQRLLVARGTPRPAFLALSCVLTTAACVVNSHGSLGALYAGAVAGGFAFGSFWSLMPAVLSEIFGTRFFATIYSSICTAPGLGSLLLATGLTSYVYESKAKDHGTGTTCAGPDCFRGAFFLIGLMSLCGMSLSLIVVAKTRARYQLIHRWLASTQ